MKKLLFLVAVLAMTSGAFAAPIFDVNVNDQPWDGTSSVNPSDVITITLSLPPTSEGVLSVGANLDGIILTGGDGIGILATSNSWTKSPAFTGIETNIWNVTPSDTTEGATRISGGTVIALAPSNLGVVEPWEVWTLSFHVPDLPDSTIIDFLVNRANFGSEGIVDATGGTGNLDAIQMSFHVIPEPMTLSLLGLGGLGLLRRRRA